MKKKLTCGVRVEVATGSVQRSTLTAIGFVDDELECFEFFELVVKKRGRRHPEFTAPPAKKMFLLQFGVS